MPISLKNLDQQGKKTDEMGERGLTQPPTKLEKKEERESREDKEKGNG